MRPTDLFRFSTDRGLSISSEDIERLWQVGLLQADYIISEGPLEGEGLFEIWASEAGEKKGYADGRSIAPNPPGWINISDRLGKLPDSLTLYFHPFRYYVLYRVVRIFDVIAPLQLLSSLEGYHRLVKMVSESFFRWSQSEEASKRIQYWNDIAALAIAAEPCCYPLIAGQRRSPALMSEDQLQQELQSQRSALRDIVQSIGLDRCEDARRELCRDTHALDSNTEVHTILRLSSVEFQNKIRGRLGGALLLRTMAEVLRRTCEDVFQTELPEEDDLGWEPRGKQDAYGSNRILDAKDAVKTEFLRSFRLDHTVRVRWYVEGDTELGVIQTALDHFDYIEIVNLRGMVHAKKGFGFRDDLRRDIKQGVFSFVSIDEDCKENAQTAVRAMQNQEVFGLVQISKPDFEFSNFSNEELQEVLWQMIAERGGTREDRTKLREAVQEAVNKREFFKSFRIALPQFASIGTNGEWGKRLLSFADKHPIREGGKERPIIELLEEAMRCNFYRYQSTRATMQMDPQSGRLAERSNS